MNQMKIRALLPQDDAALASLIRKVLIEFDVPKTGTAYADPELDQMYATYQNPRMDFWVVLKGETILGGAGIAPLPKANAQVCELQKMYFDPTARGLGMGAAMMDVCLDFARQSGYKQVYLETLPQMVHAQKLYRKYGFQDLSNPMGDTGHCNCSVWMLKDL